jgi:hypothetical protein
MPNNYANISLFIIQGDFTTREAKLNYASATTPDITCGVKLPALKVKAEQC